MNEGINEKIKEKEVCFLAEKKNVKEASGGKPGFVIYHTNYSMIIEPDISGIDFACEIKSKYPECAITLSMGERSYESYF